MYQPYPSSGKSVEPDRPGLRPAVIRGPRLNPLSRYLITETEGVSVPVI